MGVACIKPSDPKSDLAERCQVEARRNRHFGARRLDERDLPISVRVHQPENRTDTERDELTVQAGRHAGVRDRERGQHVLKFAGIGRDSQRASVFHLDPDHVQAGRHDLRLFYCNADRQGGFVKRREHAVRSRLLQHLNLLADQAWKIDPALAQSADSIDVHRDRGEVDDAEEIQERLRRCSDRRKRQERDSQNQQRRDCRSTIGHCLRGRGGLQPFEPLAQLLREMWRRRHPQLIQELVVIHDRTPGTSEDVPCRCAVTSLLATLGLSDAGSYRRSIQSSR